MGVLSRKWSELDLDDDFPYTHLPKKTAKTSVQIASAAEFVRY
jgi:hypothetical protein